MMLMSATCAHQALRHAGEPALSRRAFYEDTQPAQVERRQSLLLVHPHVADEAPVYVQRGVQHQAILGLLALVQAEHDHDAGDQCRAGGIEGDPQPRA